MIEEKHDNIFIVDKEAWANHMVDNPFKTEHSPVPTIHDFAGANYLSPVIEGYMTHPVAMYNGNAISAESVRFKDIGQTLSDMQTNGDRIILYMLIWFPSTPMYSSIDPLTFEHLVLDKPQVLPGGWLMRYVKVN